MQNGLKYLEKRLHEWANWCKKGNGFGLGFPSKTPEQKLREHGGLCMNVIGRKPFMPHPQAEEIEQYLKELAQTKRFLAMAIRIHYLDIGTMGQKAKKLCVCYSQYRIQLENAKHWLLGRLENSLRRNI